MAEPLKLFFDAGVVRSIAADLHRVEPAFRASQFVHHCMEKLDDLELTARAWRIAEALNLHLPKPFAAGVETIVAALGPVSSGTESTGMAPFRYLPHVLFVQKYGLDDFEPAMRAQYELTKRFTAESSIRAYLVRHPAATYERLRTWASDSSVHVRRLVSEGTRPRLPWAPRLRAFQEDPRPVIALLELLKDDSERYVQRSVANNLNDIGKDHPEMAVAVCARWSRSGGPGRAYIIRHGLRGLVKRGDRGALRVLGAGAKPEVEIGRVALAARRIAIGGKVRFDFEIVSTARKSQALIADYAVHFVKANGATRPKVFKLRRVALAPGARVELGATISFQDMTTRKHYAGKHRLEARINGIAYPLAELDVVPRRRSARPPR